MFIINGKREAKQMLPYNQENSEQRTDKNYFSMPTAVMGKIAQNAMMKKQ